MKIYIGPYVKWIGPHQAVEWLKYLGVSDSIREKIASALPLELFEWLDKFKKRKIYIRIDPYDTWNMDHTLALIILPMLKQIKETKYSYFFVDNEDVPEELRCGENIEDDEKGELRCNYVMDEMIWAFSAIVNEDSEDPFHFNEDGTRKHPFDMEGLKNHRERVTNGLRLFGKYYQGLWD